MSNSCLLVQPDRTRRTILEKLKADKLLPSQWEIEQIRIHQEIDEFWNRKKLL
jgi:hypothetical protein